MKVYVRFIEDDDRELVGDVNADRVGATVATFTHAPFFDAVSDKNYEFHAWQIVRGTHGHFLEIIYG